MLISWRALTIALACLACRCNEVAFNCTVLHPGTPVSSLAIQLHPQTSCGFSGTFARHLGLAVWGKHAPRNLWMGQSVELRLGTPLLTLCCIAAQTLANGILEASIFFTPPLCVVVLRS